MGDDGWRIVGLTALTVTGGAAAVVLGAGVASAGDAEAVGNTSGTSGNQALVVAPGTDPTIAALDGTVVNGGAAAANTGTNGAEEVEVTSGHARSHGNDSQSTFDQAVTSSASAGGLTVIDQDAVIGNLGLALADTGSNDGAAIDTGDAVAWGNRSWAHVAQATLVTDDDGATRWVRQQAGVDNVGLALAGTGRNTGGDITTGTASAGGNDARTTTSQRADVTGDQLSAAVVEQRARTRNRGTGIATTGANAASGDDSTNDPDD